MAGRVAVGAIVYFGVVFAIGFALGTVRVLLVEPRLGSAWSVAMEVPLMLAASWLVARRVVRSFRIETVLPALVVGIAAALLLVAAETLLGLSFGQALESQLAGYGTPRGMFTLIGQVGFALMPLLALRRPVELRGSP